MYAQISDYLHVTDEIISMAPLLDKAHKIELNCNVRKRATFTQYDMHHSLFPMPCTEFNSSALS